MPRKIISVDLDGVLNNYDGVYNHQKIPTLRDGALEFIKKLSDEYNVELFTVRDKELVESWLKENNLNDYISKVTNKKNPKTTVFLDDRAVNFNGDFKAAYRCIKEFKPHWK